MGLIEKLAGKVMTPKNIAKMTEKMLAELINSGGQKKVYRIQRVQTANTFPELGYRDTDQILVRTFLYETGEEVAQDEIGPFLQKAIKGMKIPFDLSQYVQQATDLCRRIMPESRVYFLAGMSDTEPGRVAALRCEVEDMGGPDEYHTYGREILFCDNLPAAFEQAKQAGYLDNVVSEVQEISGTE